MASASSPFTAKALVTGHFSTVGDLEVLDRVEAMLSARGIAYSVSPFSQHRVSTNPAWTRAETLDPTVFTHLIVVCGPYASNYPADYPEIFAPFRHCVHVGVNLTMVAPLEDCNPFDALIERDSDWTTRPDLSFLVQVDRVPVVGLCLARGQTEYGGRQQHDVADERLRALLRRAGLAVIELDTTVPRAMNRVGIGTAAEFESICVRLDAMVTTRLHGMVLSLKNGIPVLAVDAILGKDKVSRQADLLGWAEIHSLSETSDANLAAALQRCLLPQARDAARACAQRAAQLLADYDAHFDRALTAEADPSRRPPVAPRRGRLSRAAATYRKFKRRWIPSKR